MIFSATGRPRVWITGETDRGKGFSTHLRARFFEIYLGVKICRCLPCPAHTIGPLLCSPLTGDSSRLNTQARPLSEARPSLESPHQRESCSQEERAGSKLQDLSFMWKIFQIDEHVGTAVAGLSCDAHILVDQARIYAQSNKLMYDEPIDIEILTRRIGEIKQLYTQHAGVRPFGISMLFVGVDKKGSRL